MEESDLKSDSLKSENFVVFDPISEGNAPIPENKSMILQTDSALNNTSKMYSCNYCKYKSNRSNNVKAHIESIHEGIKFACPYCKVQFSDKSALSKHTKSVHKGIRVPCQHCDYKAQGNSNLKRHINNIHNPSIM